MKRKVDHSAMVASGYAEPWSAAPGEQVTLHLSARAAIRRVGVRRLDLPEPAPMGWQVVPAAPVAHRDFDQGSFLVLHPAPSAAVTAIRFELYLTRNEGPRTVLDAGAVSLTLRDGGIALRGGDGSTAVVEAVPARVWLDARLNRDGRGWRLDLRAGDPLAPFEAGAMLADAPAFPCGQAIHFGADRAGAGPTLNARFGRIEIDTADGRHAWRFPTRLTRDPIPSDQDPPLFLEARNLPTFCVMSARWDGSTHDPRVAPSHYDAIHCHDDDMGPLDWPASFAVTPPAEAEPGIYAFEVETDDGAEQFAFFLNTRSRRADIAFLVPTATYLAYADEVLPPHLYEWKCEDRGHRFAILNGLRSLYDFHTDRSGVSICSWRKPKATLRDDYRYPLCGCPHNLPVDLQLLRFCHEHGIGYDLLTDHDLHVRGVDALAGYRLLMTGSHPEYMSAEMERSIRDFVAGGGSLAYLGGNGFAATVAFAGDLLELRRSPLEAGRTWDGPVGEQALAITNEPGGFLRSRGQGEFSLLGVGISLMGFETGRPFTRTPLSHEPAFAWLFEGVEQASFGAEGTVLGAAAGYEVDATDPHLGTPADTAVLARATGFGPAFYHDPSRWYAGGEPEAAARRCAEMTIRMLPGGNFIFSASSVAWCGALPAQGTMNDVGRITRNLLRRRPDDGPPAATGRDSVLEDLQEE